MSSLQSGIPELEKAALRVIKKVTKGADYPAQAIMKRFDTSRPTAYKLVHLAGL